MRTTKIEWTDKTWNPITGCTKKSTGCAHCYAEVMARRLKAMGLEKYRNGFGLTLHEDDELSNVLMTDGQQNIFIGTHNGYAVSFSETAVRSMGRTAAGVRGIRLREGDYVVGSDLLIPGQEILVISEKG